MPHEKMNTRQLASYLGISLKKVTRLAAREKIPCRKIANGKFIFRKYEIDHWIWQQMHDFDLDRVADIEKGVISHHGMDDEVPIICPLLDERCTALPLDARTAPSVLKKLVRMAVDCGFAYDVEQLYARLRCREEIASTAILPGVAFPHPGEPMPNGLARSFVGVGLVPCGVPFGSRDGGQTKLFFLICCKEERTHLHVLARLVRILNEQGGTPDLIEAKDTESFLEIIAHREMTLISRATGR